MANKSIDNSIIQQLSDTLTKVTPEEQQAVLDALNDILNAKGASDPSDDITMEMDPDLLSPDNDLDIDDYDIDDPDNLLNSEDSDNTSNKKQSQSQPQSNSDQTDETSDDSDSSETDSNQNDNNENNSNSETDNNTGDNYDDYDDDYDDWDSDDSGSDNENDNDSDEGESSNQSSQQQQQNSNQQNSNQQNSNQNQETSKHNNPNNDDGYPDPTEEDDGSNQQSQKQPGDQNPSSDGNESDGGDENYDDWDDDSDLTDPNKEQSEKNKTARKTIIDRITRLADEKISKVTNGQMHVNEDRDAERAEAIKKINAVKEVVKQLQNISDEDLAKMSDEEFADKIDEALAKIGQISPVQYSDDIESRIEEIKNDVNSGEMAREIQQDDAISKQLAKRTEIKRTREKDALLKKNLKGISNFKIDFFSAIKDQVRAELNKQKTWAQPNRRHTNDGIIAKGTRYSIDKNKDIPSVDIFVDCSGSWGLDDIAVGEQALASIIEFEKRGQLKANLYYFSNRVYTNKEAALGGGTTAWEDILDVIKKDHAKNVVLITDTDMSDQAERSTGIVVPGIVWFIWKFEAGSQDWPEYYIKRYAEDLDFIKHKLVGKSGNKEYQLDR